MLNRHRVLVISKSSRLRSELVTLLSGYGYFVEECQDRLAGMKKFRAYKQSIIIIDVPSLRRFSRRIFQSPTPVIISFLNSLTIPLIRQGIQSMSVLRGD